MAIALLALVDVFFPKLHGSASAVPMPDTSSYNGLSLTPTMGWDNWNAFGCSVSEDLLLETAHSLVSLGLRDLGYTTVVLDDCWSSGRNETGHLVPDSDKFPNGMLHVANQLHALGLKFGMYSSAGAYTCGRYPGSLGHEELDAQTFAAWGVDYLKYDNCYNEGQSGTPALSFARYAAMARALSATGRDIVYGICNWGDDNPFDWAQTISNSWRMSGDIYDSFQRPDSRCPCTETPCDWPGYHCSVMNILNKMAPIQSRSQPGAFNDMDMLEVGNGGQSDSEYLTHISMWALLSSPLLIGTNIATLSPRSLSLLSNPAILALNQDPSGTAGVRKWRHQVPDVDADGQGEVALWTRELANGDTAVALLNAGNGSRVMRAGLGDVFLDQATAGAYEAPAELSQAWDVFDLWANRMSDEEAAAVIAGNSSEVAADSKTRYNATALPYADGLAANHSALVGQWVGRVQPGGSWEARIERHSVGVYRFRVADGGERDEL